MELSVESVPKRGYSGLAVAAVLLAVGVNARGAVLEHRGDEERVGDFDRTRSEEDGRPRRG